MENSLCMGLQTNATVSKPRSRTRNEIRSAVRVRSSDPSNQLRKRNSRNRSDTCSQVSADCGSKSNGAPPLSHPANLDECRLGHFVAPGSKHEGSFARSWVYIARRSTPKGWAGTLEGRSTRTGGHVMTESTDGGTFPELFEVIQGYAQRDYIHQVKALRIIAAAYLPLFEVPRCPTPRRWSRTSLAATSSC